MPLRRLSLLLTSLLVFVSCVESGEFTDILALVEAVQAEVTVANMEVELDSIVQYDRLSGSPGEFAAVEYLRRTLEAEGLAVSVDTFDAYISDPVSATVEVPGTDIAPDAITVSGSATVRGLRGEAVDLGALSALESLIIASIIPEHD